MFEKRWLRKKFLVTAAAILTGVTLIFFTILGFMLEPMLKKRLHSLIIDGSDSLYQYSLGSFHANLFGANVSLKDFKLWVDSARYQQMQSEHSLPAVTMQLDIKLGQVKGISLLALLGGNKLKIQTINSEEGQITLARHYVKSDTVEGKKRPFWKSIRSSMNGLTVDKISLENIRFAYWDLGLDDARFEFKRCDAELQDIRIDSALLADTTRLGYLGGFSLRLQGLDYLTADSVYKLGIGTIEYATTNRQLDIHRFHLQPSDSYARLAMLDTVGKTYFTLKTENIRFKDMRLEQFINANTIRAESMVIQSPQVNMYIDRSIPKDLRTKVGRYPHQLLERAPLNLMINNLVLANMQMLYTEKSGRTEKEGQIDLQDITLRAENVTNIPEAKKINPYCTITADGKILGSPITTRFKLYLDSANGRFDADGSIKNITAAQLNPIAENLASMRLNSLNIQEVSFSLTGNDFKGVGSVRMVYDGLNVDVLKRDEKTGDVETNKFLTKLLNRYMAYPSNPVAGAPERVAANAAADRLLWQSFFGLIWKTVFLGMQNIILKS
jgi:hypothetical protein